MAANEATSFFLYIIDQTKQTPILPFLPSAQSYLMQ